MALRGGAADVPAHCSTFESDGDDEPQWFKEIKQNDKDDTASGSIFISLSKLYIYSLFLLFIGFRFSEYYFSETLCLSYVRLIIKTKVCRV